MKKTLYIALAAVLFAFTSCEGWLDINYDPNSPDASNVQTSQILPAAEVALATTVGSSLNIIGGFQAQYYAHQSGNSNYLDYSQFEVSSTNTSMPYTQLYQKVIVNCKTIQDKASAQEDWGTYLAATTLRAYAFQLLIDMYGETPYTEAMDITNLAPKFDDGQTVYEGVIAELDAALAKANSGDAVATSLIFPGATAQSWIEFANAQKLKMLTRLNMVKDVKAEIKAVIDGGNLPKEDIVLANCWSNAAGQANPFFSEEFSSWGRAKNNIVANAAIIKTFYQTDDEGKLTYQDGRLEKLYEANTGGKYEGNISGTNNTTSDDPFKNTSNWCRPIQNYDSPISLISMAEINFFIAEYYYSKGEENDAKSAYEAAVEASFASLGATGADKALEVFPYDGIASIGKAKWMAAAGQNQFEAYTEARRLGYPEFGSLKGSDMYDTHKIDYTGYQPATFHTPYQVFAQVGVNSLLQRFPYAEAVKSRNTNTPEFKGYKEPIFWGSAPK